MSIQTDDFAPPPRRVVSAAPASPAEEAVERMLEALMSRERAPPSIISSPVKVWESVESMSKIL